MEKLSSTSGLVILQKKEWGEILSGFETKNKYEVMDAQGQLLYAAFEVAGSFIIRTLLRAMRPFEIHLFNLDQQLTMRLNRPFRFYFHRLEVLDAQGILLGTIERQFSILRRKYIISDSDGRMLFELFGPILHPWTFNIRKDGDDLGKITKKWSGLLKEAYTDADNFGVSYQPELDIKSKAILLGAVFLIDFVHFEGKNNS
jgi:uncharacterized protein YxjI